MSIMVPLVMYLDKLLGCCSDRDAFSDWKPSRFALSWDMVVWAAMIVGLCRRRYAKDLDKEDRSRFVLLRKENRSGYKQETLTSFCALKDLLSYL